MEGTGRTALGAIDASKSSVHRERENIWMKELSTIYTYGLNHDTGKWIQYGDYVTGHEYEGHTLTKTVNQYGDENRQRHRFYNMCPFLIGKGSKLVLIMCSLITFLIYRIC